MAAKRRTTTKPAGKQPKAKPPKKKAVAVAKGIKPVDLSMVLTTRPAPLLTIRAPKGGLERNVKGGEAERLLAVQKTFERLDLELNAIHAKRQDAMQWGKGAHEQLKVLRAQVKKAGGPAALDKDRALKRDVSHLVVGLANNHAAMARLNARRHDWHGALTEAERAIDVRKRLGKEFLGEALGIGPQLHLEAAHARFMLRGNHPELRDQLAAARREYPDHDGLVYWSMRYDLMSARYTEAHQAFLQRELRGGRIDPRILNELLPLLDRSRARSPEEAYPCNFHTYRYTLFGSDALQIAREQLAQAQAEGDSTLKLLWKHVLDAWQNWNEGNDHLNKRRFSSAEECYEACGRSVVAYFKLFERYYDGGEVLPSTPKGTYDEMVRIARKWFNPAERKVQLHFRHRYQSVTLDQLRYQDWERPKEAPSNVLFYADPPRNPFGAFKYAFQRGFIPSNNVGATPGPSGTIVTALIGVPAGYAPGSGITGPGLLFPGPHEERPAGLVYQTARDKIIEKIHCPLLALGLIHCRMAIAESRRMRQDHDGALTECYQLLRRHQEFKMLSQFIEVPFIKILMGQVMIEKGDAQYKRKERRIPTDPNSQLKAYQTYRRALMHFQDQGRYVHRVNSGCHALRTDLARLLTPARHSLALAANKVSTAQRAELLDRLGRIPVEDLRLDRQALVSAGPHQGLLQFQRSNGTALVGDTNPLIYQLVLQAQARIRQIEAGLNFLGYTDDFVPPWRFTYLLERARYFTGNAKGAQSTYLNFLANAEREEFQEMTVSQRVSEERQNIRMEEARIEQARQELEVAKESAELAEMQAEHARERQADDDWLENGSNVTVGMGAAITTGASVGGVVGTFIGGPVGTVVGAIVGGAVGAAVAFLAVDQQIDESKELQRAVDEAAQAKQVADAQVGAALARLEVAVCQMGVALLRHDFAVQALNFHRRRTLNSENWFRLAFMIRAIAENYLRYAVELAYLTEQAYEFEADKRMDVIRFDYDLDEVAGLLAADFLGLDLDSLEHDMLVSEKVRAQTLKYTVSLARDFPTSFRQLRETGATDFALSLERLERKFPGLYNLRIGQVDMLPIALMDPTGFAVELTHLGHGAVRLKRGVSTPSRPAQGSWAAVANDPLSTLWPARTHIMGPETAVFTGLNRADRDASAPLFSAAQRNAFERRPGASAWRIAMDLEENRIVPNAMADVQITFHLNGYHDAALRDSIIRAPRSTHRLTQAVSAHQVFPDNFYDFKQTGEMQWPVGRDLMQLNPPASPLRNLGVVLAPASNAADHGAVFSRHRVIVRVDRNGVVTPASFVPQYQVTIARLVVSMACGNFPAAGTIRWDMGDGSPLIAAAQAQHTYARSGQYTVRAMLFNAGRAMESTFHVNVSADVDVPAPFTAYPNLAISGNASVRTLTFPLNGARNVDSITGRFIGQQHAPRINEGNRRISFDVLVDPSMDQEFEVEVLCIRQLAATFTGDQGSVQPGAIVLDRLKAGSDRRYDLNGVMDPASGTSPFTTAVMGNIPLAPTDRWRLSMNEVMNPFLRTHLPNRPDLRQLSDARLLLQFDVR